MKVTVPPPPPPLLSRVTAANGSAVDVLESVPTPFFVRCSYWDESAKGWACDEQVRTSADRLTAHGQLYTMMPRDRPTALLRLTSSSVS